LPPVATWLVKYQPLDGGPRVLLPIVATSSESAWDRFMAWRMMHFVGYHAVVVYRR
jgi:hypothetical protein